MKIKIFAIILLSTILQSCDNSLDLNAPYKEIAVVYAFLDQNEPLQIIRIEKAFQNADGTTVQQGAQIGDSLYFDTLYVTLKNLNTGTIYVCSKVDTIPKDSGFFGNSKSIHYVTQIPKNNTAEDEFELEIVNPTTGNYYKSKTKFVKDADIEGRNIFLTLNPNTYIPFRFQQAKNAVIHDCAIRFIYTESENNNPAVSVLKYVDYFVSKNTEYNNVGGTIDLRIQSLGYINYLKSKITVNNNVTRKVVGIEYRVYGGGSDFKTLLDLAKPNTTIVQKKPEFTNIENGLGIFTSRNLTSITKPKLNLDATSDYLLTQQLPNFTQ